LRGAGGAARANQEGARESMPTQVEAQIAGSVWKVEKAVGDRVEPEEVLLILESMKMEIPVEAPCGGQVLEIRVREGDSIEEGAVLAVIG
jgi:acetyl-CoA carboxylase biotin carboxyl carrier protein